MKINLKTRKNGFDKPLNKYQILSWIIYFLEILFFVLFYLPPLQPLLKIICGSFIGTSTLSTIFFGILVTKSDPTDKAVYEEIDARMKNKLYITTLKHYCTICKTHVNSRTKHCGQCNRCVHIFDHHCEWLNNCVGQSNYRLFIRLISSLLMLSLFKIIVSTYILILYNNNFQDFNLNVQMVVELDNTSKVIYVFVIISLCINIIVFLIMCELIGFHIWLYTKKMTTYEYILSKRKSNHKLNSKIQNPNNNLTESYIKDGEKSTKSKLIIVIDNLHPNHPDDNQFNSKYSTPYGESELEGARLNFQKEKTNDETVLNKYKVISRKNSDLELISNNTNRNHPIRSNQSKINVDLFDLCKQDNPGSTSNDNEIISDNKGNLILNKPNLNENIKLEDNNPYIKPKSKNNQCLNLKIEGDMAEWEQEENMNLSGYNQKDNDNNNNNDEIKDKIDEINENDSNNNNNNKPIGNVISSQMDKQGIKDQLTQDKQIPSFNDNKLIQLKRSDTQSSDINSINSSDPKLNISSHETPLSLNKEGILSQKEFMFKNAFSNQALDVNSLMKKKKIRGYLTHNRDDEYNERHF